MIISLCRIALSFAMLLRTTQARPPYIGHFASRTGNGIQHYEVCAQIQKYTSSETAVFYPGDAIYVNDTSHYFSSSSQQSTCSVEPGTPDDIGITLGILGLTQTPFAVKGGGHASNPGFSSTSGVQISMARFSDMVYDAGSQSATVGSGLLWDDVYAALAPYNVTAIGGRVSGLGVAGVSLGGGYSWKTNQYGLTVDTILAFELVKPNGDVLTVTKASDLKLFSALKGGHMNFGIVTRFTFKTVPQGSVWGGMLSFNESYVSAVNTAIARYSASVTDPKASMVTSLGFTGEQVFASVVMFYDGPTPPPGIFDDFLDIPYITKDIGTRDYLSLIKAASTGEAAGSRGIFHTVPLLHYSRGILDMFINETLLLRDSLANKSSVYLAYAVEPFLPTILSHNDTPSAYPADRSVAYSPLNIYFSWSDETFDADFHNAISESAKRIYDFAIAEGQDIAGALLYPNYALDDTPMAGMYGQGNIEGLRCLKDSIDPTHVMGLAGGFKF